jgi:hypothetical protein
MIKRSTWILLGIFGVVLAFAIYYQYSPRKAVVNATSTPGTTVLFNNVDEKSISTLRVEDINGKAVALGRDTAGVWAVTEPKGGPTDVAQAEMAVSQLLELASTASLDPSSDLGIFGLSKASYTITITMNGGEKYVLLIGDVTPTQNGYYARLDQEPPDIVNKTSIDALLGLLAHPPFLVTSTSEITITPTAGTVTPVDESQQPTAAASMAVTETLPPSNQPATATPKP